VHVGSCTLQVRAGRGEQYILAQLISSNSGWHDGWFYLRNDDDWLPRFSEQVLMSREENWSYSVVEEDKPKLQPLLDALRRLRQRRLTAGMVAAAFHQWSALLLMQRRLRIDEMTPRLRWRGVGCRKSPSPSMKSPGVHGGWWGASSRRTSTGSRCAPLKALSLW
jgi:hypothetical protein